ncbi:MAG: PilZ domain-containing protein [Deltaproteobacteria bacterium]|nr:PilZ domain-containing protein [Deltaproteobacteria bacterium]
MSPPGAPAARVLAVGSDADVCVALHQHLPAAGYALYCVPTPGELEPLLRAIAPQVIVLLLPASPDASWGGALTTTAAASRVGVRVVVVAPSREVVEPLAAVAGAERALSRAEVLSRPALVVDRGAAATPAPVRPPPPAAVVPPAPPPVGPPAFTLPSDPPAGPPPAPLQPLPPLPPRRPAADLMALIDEELVDEPKGRPQLTRVEVNVSLVSEHNFFVGQTRRLDSGGVFISTALPPPVGTRLQLRLGLPDGRKIDLEGEVAYVREKSAIGGRQPSGCGVKLIGLPAWAIDAIDRFLLARPPIVYATR